MVDKQETDIYALGMSFLKIRCDSFSKELSENCNLQNRNKKIETLLIKFVQQFEKEQELMDSVHEMVQRVRFRPSNFRPLADQVLKSSAWSLLKFGQCKIFRPKYLANSMKCQINYQLYVSFTWTIILSL